MRKPNTIARIENVLIFDTEYQLTAKEQKVILLLISKVDPNKPSLGVQVVGLKELEKILVNRTTSRSFTTEINKFSKRILQKQLTFKSNSIFRGERLEGHINWLQSIVPTKTATGEVAMEFQFSEKLKPFLLELKEYVQIDYQEVLPLKSGFAVRLFQICKAYRNKMSKHQRQSKLQYSLKELKRFLGLEGKYKDFRNFRLKVLVPITKEINEHTSIRIKFDLIKKSRTVVGISFEFWDAADKEVTLQYASALTFDDLSFAQVKAFNRLIGYNIKEAIALQMISKAQGSEIKGFEDWYFESVIGIFEAKTNQEGEAAKAGTLVNWFLKKKVFEQGDMFARIMEQLQARKKKLQVERPDAWENRLVARDMTYQEFKTLYRKT